MTSTTSDPDPADNTSSAASAVITSADVAITKSGPGGIAAGTDYAYAISVANSGPSDAANVAFTDTLPANVTFVSIAQSSGPAFTCITTTSTVTCTAAALPAGATAAFTLNVHLSSSAPNGSSVVNSASVTTTTTDPDGSDNTSTTTGTVSTTADVSVTKSGPDVANAGSTITYIVTVANAGPADAASVLLNDNVPAGTTFVSATQTSGPPFTCVTPAFGASSGLVQCSIVFLSAGASASFQFVFNVPATAQGPIVNTATVTSPSDSTPGNGSAAASANVVGGQNVPTLSQWALLLLAIALAGCVLLRLR